MSKAVSTHTAEQEMRVEAETGLQFAGYMATETKDSLIPIFLQPGHSRERNEQLVYKANGMRGAAADEA